ncbi:hypothetical protein N7462_007370 [Penicillium macrosclerotiorum]|uniref:uncharacterized protein n=1 Tax=Penicillium macrosclerotiorum TaxID=303699 RepID=UPI0025476C9D|nr:uncharacterized protein N7462_007370 [Penicillium macrosclerotiorum]KAJ5679126.1 hypothetical protein N7462_007370 [Penicillium macrosclerotiorum]
MSQWPPGPPGPPATNPGPAGPAPAVAAPSVGLWSQWAPPFRHLQEHEEGLFTPTETLMSFPPPIMSTFNGPNSFLSLDRLVGVVGKTKKIPIYAVDYFRKSEDRPPPLACFLTHVHSDHLLGLESFRSPFIYCSPATRELLLGLEKWPHRINFEQGILEARRVHYRHLQKLLRPIPLNTPTIIDLTPVKRLRVTLIDANHCPGSVMFLIEGEEKAILYTGDPWWINSLVRNPVLIPYTLGPRRLDTLYLDTTHLSRKQFFVPKADGIAELLQKVLAYPKDTVFHIRAWTFGYEEVWQALAIALDSQIHVDPYQLRLYRSLAKASSDKAVNESSIFNGFKLGNTTIEGILTDDKNVRLHSCEPGTACINRAHRCVDIMPFLCRSRDGQEEAEPRARNDKSDLYPAHEIELTDKSTAKELERRGLALLDTTEDRKAFSYRLSAAFSMNRSLSLNELGIRLESNVPLDLMVETIVDCILSYDHQMETLTAAMFKGERSGKRDVIHYPFARHSSYAESCSLVGLFYPKDVYPCTYNDTYWRLEKLTVENLFGHLCSEKIFAFDKKMRSTVSDMDPGLEWFTRSSKFTRQLQTQSTPSHSEIGDSDLDRPGSQQVSSSQLRSVSTLSQSSSPAPQNFLKLTTPAEDTPSTTPDPGRELRNEIRRAQQYLQEQVDPAEMQIGALPTAWPSAEDDMFDADTEMDTGMGSEQPYRSIFGGDGGSDPVISTQEKGAPTAQNNEPQMSSQTLSTSDSKSTLSGVELTADLLRDAAEFVNDLDEEEDPTQTESRKQTRITAFLAAQEDTYAAWADVSLVSAGDNHAEEEIEL